MERYESPEELVIATNYEGPSLMFYLGSRVTVGFYAAELEQDREIPPDVVFPRPWPEQLEVLRELAGRGDFERVVLPVENLPWNNNPALSPRSDHPTAHRFRTPPARDGRPELLLFLRRS